MTYFASKYSDALTDLLDTIAADWMIEWSGATESNVGSFTEPIGVTQQALTSHQIQDGNYSNQPTVTVKLWDQFVTDNDLSLAEQVEVLNALQSAESNSAESWFILRGNDQGFIWSESFNSKAEAQTRFKELQADYWEWDNQCFDCGSATDDNGDCTTDNSHSGRLD